jgi:hypothetical protein
MNARILQIRFSIFVLILLLLGCLQGPWDYYPEKVELHRGLWVTGYIIADRPVQHFCIEKLLDLDEEYTDAFVFYQDASVEITGVFSGTRQILTLEPDSDQVNCFLGDPLMLAEQGEEYDLDARVTWDSAGQTVETRITAAAHVPEFFEVSDTARAPALALTGLAVDTSGDTTSGFPSVDRLLGQLPPNAREEILDKYEDTLTVLFTEGDSIAILEFIISIRDEITQILQEYYIEYENGDSLFYLTGLDFFLLSHLFKSRRSADMEGVLITLGLDSIIGDIDDGLGPIFGVIELDTANYSVPGSHRRLIEYDDFTGDDGYSILDSMGFVQAWFYAGLNTIYFYGIEEAYAEYVTTAILNESNTKVKSVYNVDGAAGIFTGMVADSFKVYIKADAGTDVYPRDIALRANCQDRGFSGTGKTWDKSKECRELYPEFCESVRWHDPECIPDLHSTALELGMDMQDLLDSLRTLDSMWWLDTLMYLDSLDSLKMLDSLQKNTSLDSSDIAQKLDSLLALDPRTLEERLDSLEVPEDSLGFSAAAFEKSLKEGEIRYCVDNNYPNNTGVCTEIREECTFDEGVTTCKKYLWQYCLDRKWKPDQCGTGLVSYCTDQPRRSEILCSHADEYCNDHPGEPLCNK